MIAEAASGIVLGYDDLGASTDPAVILIGGLATQRTVWPDALCERLVTGGFRVVRFDNRDTGESTWWEAPTGAALMELVQDPAGWMPKLPYTIDDMADDTAGLLDILGIARAHVVGMSMGGRIAQAMAVRHPGKVESLVSMMSTTGNPSLPPPRPEAMNALMTPPDDPYDVDAVTRLAIMQQSVIGSPAYQMPDNFARAVVALNFSRGNNPEGALRQWAASVGAGDRRRELVRIAAPTLVLHGRDDPLVPVAAGEDTARSISRAQMRIIDGWGHNIPPSIAPILAAEMLAFWSSLS